ncbi:MAG: NAD-dependent protein deacylase [Candidatus Methanomethylicota archaeon]|uniref:NAD-dependent protein deacylase n=1 Tax=Thermoproteota archaeon TaxID=2056631 RepID=A0A497F4L1_9CREN|nr:MAG: NAD-dependent protein deacylase [Candidatus Verstraetearchaeota archaeon]
MTMVDIEEFVARAAEILVNSRHAVCLTGAGISAESGIPTFRGKDGLWKKFRVEDLATPEAFKRNPNLVWEWYKWRMQLVYNARPNAGHFALVDLETMGILKCIVTQNVDGLHLIAGSKCVVELHGSIRRGRCIECDFKVTFDNPPETIPPKCTKCGCILRPDVVWFGEPIPSQSLNKALELFHKADVALVVGTSGVVYPAGYFPYIVKEKGGAVIEVNIDKSAITPIADVFIRGKAGEILPKIVDKIKLL